MNKQCISCKQIKNSNCFHNDKNKKDGLASFCKECRSVYSKQWNATNKEYKKVQDTEWYEKNREKANAARAKYYSTHRDKILSKNRQLYKDNPSYFKNVDLKKIYGITLDQYNYLLKLQNYACAICKKHENVFIKALAVDHCHKTNKVRGLLCSNCNRALGNFKDSVENVVNAAEYLRKAENI